MADARAVLAHVVTNELPRLEDAIAARDFDAALAYGAMVRSARQQVRSLLAGGDQAGILRTEWGRVEARLDAALVAAPRPNPDRENARRQWNLRLARGTNSQLARPPAPARPDPSGELDEMDTLDVPVDPRLR